MFRLSRKGWTTDMAGEAPRRRADARRNEKALLDAAAEVFVTSGVEAPVRDIAARAGVGVGTVYRHFPTRADLVIAEFRHLVEARAAAAANLREAAGGRYEALASDLHSFVAYLVTKQRMDSALRYNTT